MLMCRGKGCNWRRQCSRYVLGKAVKVVIEREQRDACISDAEREQARRDNGKAVDVSAEWMDHCLQHQQKFERKQEQDDACISHAEREQTRDEYPKFIRIGWADGEGPVKMQEG